MKEIYNKYKTIIRGILFSLVPLVTFYLMEFYQHNPFEEVRAMAAFFNILLFEMLAWIIYIFTGRAKWALRVVVIGAMIFGLVNHYVMAFRSTPFVPWDIYSIRTAASVAGKYDFTPEPRVIIVSVIFIAMAVLVRFMNFKMEMKWKFRLIPGILVTVLLVLFAGRLQDEEFQKDNYLYPFLFTPAYMTQVNGMAVTFTMNLAYVHVSKPSGYSVSDCQKTLEEYDKSEENDSTDSDLPNIIVVMDEAFSDLGVIGDFDTTSDYMPFVHSMMEGKENTVSGYLNVSVCGGNTANSEFEFLTGNTMRFLPTGSIPYQQYVKKETPSLASYLETLGYVTYAQHPYNASGWNRDQVYPLMGFENLSFREDYSHIKTYRGYISDETSFEKIIRTYESKPKNKPAFIFNVTMQNHGGYTDSYPDISSGVQAIGKDSDPLNQYLSLIKLTDSAYEKLIEYFSNVDEKTVVVFFGDHQPNDYIAGFIRENDSKDTDRYKVPYVIWANYDIGQETGQDTSLNYLAAHTLKLAGVPTSAYQNFLLDLEQTYPVISSVKLEEASGSGKDSDEADNEELLDTYQALQYYRLFDWEGDSQ